MASTTRSDGHDSRDLTAMPAGQVDDAPWFGPHWADLVRLPAPRSQTTSQPLAQKGATGERLDEEVSSFDDLFVSVRPRGRLALECPVCGPIPVPVRRTTLSDLTNAAMDHLSDQHLNSVPLPGREAAAIRPAPVHPDDTVPKGYFTDHFWSLVGLLGEAESVDALVRALASSSEKEILAFQEQLKNAADLLDTPAHRRQQVRDHDDPLQTVPAVAPDHLLADVRMAVVASGRETWLGVLADPSRLAGGWSLRAGRVLAKTPAAALKRITTAPLHPSSSEEDASSPSTTGVA